MSNSPGAKCIALAIVLTAACSADAGPPSVTFLSVEPAEIALSVGDTIRVQWEVLPIGAAGSVALRAEGSVTVTRDGLVTAMRAGPGLVIASVGARADSSRISVAAPGEVGLFTQIEAGYYHACASDQQRHVFCWGPGSAALGLGRLPAEAVRIPEATASLAELTQLSGGGDFTCGLSTQSVVYCWGNDEYGQLGLGGASDSCGAIRCELFPTPIVDVLFDTVVAGGSHACALRAGEAYCWGYGAYGRLGDGSTVHRNAPTRVQGNLEFTRIAAGGTHTCAIARDDHGYCWGYSAGGQIGDGIPGSTNRILPTRVAADDRFVTVVTGVAHSCALTVDGARLVLGSEREWPGR